jgi:hypothetical protein
MRPESVIQFNKFAKLHNGKDIFFCKTDYLARLFASLKGYYTPSVLISGNSDYPLTDAMIAEAPMCIRKWFAQSVNTTHPMAVAMPYGLENTDDCIVEGHGKGHGRGYKVEAAANPPDREPTKELYANFSLDTHPVRGPLYQLCESLPYVTTNASPSHGETNNRPYQVFVDEIVDHKMVICPRGNAPAETHRFWETLYFNRVPIIKQNQGNSFFAALPVVVLEDWEQLKDKAFLDVEWARVKDNSREMLEMSYWESLILNECM